VFSEIKELKRQTSLKVNLHAGLIDKATAEMISRSGVDKVSFDLIYSDRCIRNVLHLDRKKEDYIATLGLFEEHDIPYSPHILAGLDNGIISWEYDAVDRLGVYEPDEVILIIFIPTKGTPMEHIPPTSHSAVIELGGYMRAELSSRLVLGCMRPKGDRIVEMGLMEAGFNGIVLPSRSTLDQMRERGWEIVEERTCCCF
jgi:uncharacterized radical SAM superfamily protein